MALDRKKQVRLCLRSGQNIDQDHPIDDVYSTNNLTCFMESLHRWIKTDCGRAKLADLQQRRGPLAKARLTWFILIAALRDWPLSNPDQSDASTS